MTYVRRWTSWPLNWARISRSRPDRARCGCSARSGTPGCPGTSPRTRPTRAPIWICCPVSASGCTWTGTASTPPAAGIPTPEPRSPGTAPPSRRRTAARSWPRSRAGWRTRGSPWAATGSSPGRGGSGRRTTRGWGCCATARSTRGAATVRTPGSTRRARGAGAGDLAAGAPAAGLGPMARLVVI